MQEKESIVVVWCELTIPSLGITARIHSASIVMPNSYPRDGILNPHLTTTKESHDQFPLFTTYINSDNIGITPNILIGLFEDVTITIICETEKIKDKKRLSVVNFPLS